MTVWPGGWPALLYFCNTFRQFLPPSLRFLAQLKPLPFLSLQQTVSLLLNPARPETSGHFCPSQLHMTTNTCPGPCRDRLHQTCWSSLSKGARHQDSPFQMIKSFLYFWKPQEVPLGTQCRSLSTMTRTFSPFLGNSPWVAPKGSHLPPLEQTLLLAGHQPPEGSGCCSKTIVRPPHTVWFFRLSPPPISLAIFSDPCWTANLALDARASFRRACHMVLTTPLTHPQSAPPQPRACSPAARGPLLGPAHLRTGGCRCCRWWSCLCCPYWPAWMSSASPSLSGQWQFRSGCGRHGSSTKKISGLDRLGGGHSPPGEDTLTTACHPEI